jgi:hypothetical protein
VKAWRHPTEVPTTSEVKTEEYTGGEKKKRKKERQRLNKEEKRRHKPY